MSWSWRFELEGFSALHYTPFSNSNSELGVRFFLVEPKSCFHAGDFVARRGAIASICRRPASLDLGLAFRWPISRARRQMRGDRIKCLGLRTYRTSCINATDSICRRARMESRNVVKLGQWARVDDKSNRSRSACGNATCGTFQHFRIAPFRELLERVQLTENGGHCITEPCILMES